MHEISLMAEVIQLVSEDAKLKGINKIEKIELTVGDLSNVLHDALELAFIYFKEEGLVSENATLHINREKASALCMTCKNIFEPDYRIAFCPECKTPSSRMISGESFMVNSYEGSE
ncbi:hydrogenase nickel insertion protein HypA [Alkalihalophilus pseudofirmus OF4]|uniref:Hydrogenase maturation factor HypA n=1 Tax=Alkalihalophilus pseudofirmus (strain ATCC BAA-2126 / JCM 17055 / OF4) TaxID=398511 RepID=D3FUD3_ALKPO|nr:MULTISPECIES: hydrogenase maturation nickel metallochaperone HypA [Alkalihalophilus]ADC48335.1 hydrogenase nickel insertion protein HypA [Alkalihalophilus pseudofirmus OF4]MED1601163.1 hydrogenase maturation nickel metallochaperone HypA [Alkalihalophilus marmarensis]